MSWMDFSESHFGCVNLGRCGCKGYTSVALGHSNVTILSKKEDIGHIEVRPDRENKTQFFKTVVLSIPLYGCTTWTLTKRMEKKYDGNYTRMLRAEFNKSWKKQSEKQQLHGLLKPFMKTMQVWRNKHRRHCWGSKDKLKSNLLQ